MCVVVKIVFLAGSRRFAGEIGRIANILNSADVTVLLGRDSSNVVDKGDIITEKMKERINESDIIYVMAKHGYVGSTVTREITYAAGNGKEIIASETIKDPRIRQLVPKIMDIEGLLAYLKNSP